MDTKTILVALCVILVLLYCVVADRQLRRRQAQWGDAMERRVGRIEAQVVTLREELERKDLNMNARINEIDRRVSMAEAPTPRLFDDEEE